LEVAPVVALLFDRCFQDKSLARQGGVVQQAAEVARRGLPPSWLEVDREALRATVKDLPKREELITPEMNEQLIVELYSR